MKNIIPDYNIPFNFLNLDIQGAELKAMKGMGDYLKNFDYVYTEINDDHLYINCALVSDLDDFLLQYGLVRVETCWTDCKWGDAFYIKKDLIPPAEVVPPAEVIPPAEVVPPADTL